MGLDTTHDCWHGAYSAFHRWRIKIAEVAGLPPLELMEGFWTPPSDPGFGNAHGLALCLRVAASTLDRFSLQFFPARPGEDLTDRPGARLLRDFDLGPVQWDCLRPSALHDLLRHSDCDGSIAADDCGPIADALEALLPKLPDEDAGGHIGNWKEKTQRFINGLRKAAAAGEDVEFH